MITHVGWKRAWREKCDPQRTSSWNWGVASGHRRRDVRQYWRRPSELPLIEEILDPKEVEKAPGPWRLIGAEVSEQLDYEPRRFLRQRLVRHTHGTGAAAPSSSPEPRGYGARSLHSKGVRLIGKSPPELDGELGRSRPPGYRWIFPLFSDVSQDQIDKLSGRFVAGKVPPILKHFAQLHM